MGVDCASCKRDSIEHTLDLQSKRIVIKISNPLKHPHSDSTILKTIAHKHKIAHTRSLPFNRGREVLDESIKSGKDKGVCRTWTEYNYSSEVIHTTIENKELDVELGAPPLELLPTYNPNHIFLASHLYKSTLNQPFIREYCQATREELRCYANKEVSITSIIVPYNELEIVTQKFSSEIQRTYFEIIPKPIFWTRIERRVIRSGKEDNDLSRGINVDGITFEDEEEAQDYLQYKTKRKRQNIKKGKKLTFYTDNKEECQRWVYLLNWILNSIVSLL